MKFYTLNIPADKKEEVTELYLGSSELESVPSIAFECPNLQILDLSYNKIKALPVSLKYANNFQKINLCGNLLKENSTSLTYLPSSLQELNLSKNKLTVFPEQISHLCNLKTLDLSQNKLSKISASIQKMTSLRHLYLANNNLKSLLAAVGKLKELRKIDLSHNFFLKYPNALTKCLQLNEIKFTDNRLNILPSAIGDCTELSNLNFHNNKLKDLPVELSRCLTLRNLNLSQNKFEKIPPCVFQLNWLRELNFSKNKLVKVDLNFTSRALEVLHLEFNKITTVESIPILVREIFLDFNQLTEIPKAILRLTNLATLGISVNKITSLPNDTLSLGSSLISLDISRNPIKSKPENLFFLRRLEKLNGLLPKKQREEFIDFVGDCKSMIGMDSLALITTFYRLTKGDKRPLDDMTVLELIQALNLSSFKANQIVRKHLYKKAGPLYNQNKLKPWGCVAFLGFSFFDVYDLRERLAVFNIKVDSDISLTATHIIVGWGKVSAQLKISPGVTFMSEKTFAYALSKMEKGYLLDTKNKKMLKPIRQLLLNSDRANVDLAVELLKNGGCPHVILTDLFLQWLSYRENNILSLLATHLEDDWKKEVFLDYSVGELKDRTKLHEYIKKLSRKNKLDVDKIEAAISPSIFDSIRKK